MATNYIGTYTKPTDKDCSTMVLASKNGYWQTVWNILDNKPYLVNSIPLERSWGILHQAVWWSNIEAVRKVLAVPGCDSELLTKNGLRPLDIGTTNEIKALLNVHLGASELVKASFFLSPLELKVPKDGIVPNKLTIEELKEQEQPQLNKISEASKQRDWKKLFSILKFWSHLINMVHPDTGLAVIHHAAIAGDVKAVTEVLNYKACDPNVTTQIPAVVGGGKTAAEITSSTAVIEAIRSKLGEMNKRYTVVPTFVAPEEAQMNLMWYVYWAIEDKDNKICDTRYSPSYFLSFPEMERHIYDFITTGNNWELARNSYCRELYGKDAKKSNQLASSQTKDELFVEILRNYTGAFYFNVNLELRNHPSQLLDHGKKFRVYTALTNAVLFHGDCNGLSKPYNGTTYRGVTLSDKQLEDYKVGAKFAWISFTSTSKEKNKAFDQHILFIIENNLKCPWSPRGIAGLSSYSSEDECIYPCGAQFEVTAVNKVGLKKEIHLKLICTGKTAPPLRLIYEQTKHRYAVAVQEYEGASSPLLAGKRQLAEASKQLQGLLEVVERNRNYETQVVEHCATRVKLPRGTKAYHCRDCNSTCHIPCPSSDMFRERCVFCIPAAEAACATCRGKCHFSRHTRVNYKIEEILEARTNIDNNMKRRFVKSESKYISKETECQLRETEFLSAINSCNLKTLLLKMQEECNELIDVLSVEETQQWSQWDKLFREACDGRVFVETCRFEMEQQGLL